MVRKNSKTKLILKNDYFESSGDTFSWWQPNKYTYSMFGFDQFDQYLTPVYSFTNKLWLEGYRVKPLEINALIDLCKKI